MPNIKEVIDEVGGGTMYVMGDIMMDNYRKDLQVYMKDGGHEMDHRDGTMVMLGFVVAKHAAAYMNAYQETDTSNPEEMKQLNDKFLALHEALSNIDTIAQDMLSDAMDDVNEEELYTSGVEALVKEHPEFEEEARAALEDWKQERITSAELAERMNNLLKEAA